MRKFYFRFKCRHGFKLKKIVGIILGIIGFMLIINMISVEILLVLIGLVLIVMAFLLWN